MNESISLQDRAWCLKFAIEVKYGSSGFKVLHGANF